MAQPSTSATAAPPGRQPPYVPALDGLRAVSILLVLASHAGLDRWVPGALGVTLFFFISGYLISRQLLASLAASGRIGLGAFYLRRALRLLPAGLLYVAVAGLAYWAAGGRITGRGWAAALFYGANFYDLWAGYRSTLAGIRHPFNILWSLAIEEHFYLAWPIVLAALWRRRAALAVAIALCGGACLWRFWLFRHCHGLGSPDVCGIAQDNPLWRTKRLYIGTDTRFDSILWGAILALAEQRKPGCLAAGRWWMAGGTLLLAASFLIPGDFSRAVLRTTLQGAGLTLLVPAAIALPSTMRTALASPPAVLAGRLSYSLYLWHWGAFAIADWLYRGQEAPWRQLTIGLPLALTLAAASYVCVERPMLRFRRLAGSHAGCDPLPPVLGPAHAAA